MKMSSVQLAALYSQLDAYRPRLEVIAVDCPDQSVPPTFVPPTEETVTGAPEFAYIADHNEDGTATIQIKVEVIDGEYRGKVSDDYYDPPAPGASFSFTAVPVGESGVAPVAITAVPPEVNQ